MSAGRSPQIARPQAGVREEIGGRFYANGYRDLYLGSRAER